jgi:hypothetical protein
MFTHQASSRTLVRIPNKKMILYDFKLPELTTPSLGKRSFDFFPSGNLEIIFFFKLLYTKILFTQKLAKKETLFFVIVFCCRLNRAKLCRASLPLGPICFYRKLHLFGFSKNDKL